MSFKFRIIDQNAILNMYFSFVNFRFPPWVDGIFQYTNDTLEQILAIHMETATHTNLMKKMKAGYLIKEMLDRFKNKSLSQLQPDRSLWIYSAHDMTIANLLNSLGLFEVRIFSVDLIKMYQSTYPFSATCTGICIKFIL